MDKKHFNITASVGDHVQCFTVEHTNAFELAEEFKVWVKETYGFSLGSINEYGVMEQDRTSEGFKLEITEVTKPRQKKQTSSTGAWKTTTSIVGNAVAEGIAIQRRKELDVFAKGLDDDGNEVTVTIADIFGTRPSGYKKPPSPSSKGPVPKDTQNVSNHYWDRKNNAKTRRFDVPLGVRFDLIMDLIKHESTGVPIEKKIETPYQLVRFVKRSGKKGIGQHSKIVDTMPSGLEQMKRTAKILHEQMESQYLIVKDGKVVFATREW